MLWSSKKIKFLIFLLTLISIEQLCFALTTQEPSPNSIGKTSIGSVAFVKSGVYLLQGVLSGSRPEVAQEIKVNLFGQYRGLAMPPFTIDANSTKYMHKDFIKLKHVDYFPQSKAVNATEPYSFCCMHTPISWLLV